MQLNTTCTCNACRNIPNLDLKFLVHFGTYVLQDMLTYKELVGSDVNLVHRLLKNRIVEATGIAAYAAYTQPAVEELDVQPLCQTMQPHRESYEHLGEIGLYVQDMHAVWEQARQQQRVVVEPEKALLILETEIPAPPPLVWDYVTKPEYRAILMGADSMRRDDPASGRTSTGTVYYCAHGDTWIPQLFPAPSNAATSSLTKRLPGQPSTPLEQPTRHRHVTIPIDRNQASCVGPRAARASSGCGAPGPTALALSITSPAASSSQSVSPASSRRPE